MRMASVEGKHVAVKKTKSWVPSFQLILTQALLYTSYLNSNKERWQDAAFPALEKQVWSQRQCPHILVLVSGVSVPSYQSCTQPSSRHRSHSSPISCLPSWYESSSAQQSRCLPILPPGQSSQPPPDALLWSPAAPPPAEPFLWYAGNSSVPELEINWLIFIEHAAPGTLASKSFS